jgi:hypothetical protein
MVIPPTMEWRASGIGMPAGRENYQARLLKFLPELSTNGIERKTRSVSQTSKETADLMSVWAK